MGGLRIFCLDWLGQRLQLHPYKAVYWEQQATLMLADLHLGKAQHFRRAGIPVPPDAEMSTWDKLISLLLGYHPERVLILGDLFHSVYNPVWEEFVAFVEQWRPIRFELITGNHDILSDYQYEKAGLIVHQEPLEEGPFLFAHEPLEVPHPDLYGLAGHVHPAVTLRGAARQRLRLPCFYFGERQAILPAFGAFTGMADLKPKAEDQVFVISGTEVSPV